VNDPKKLLPGDTLIGFWPNGPVSVVSNKIVDDTCQVTVVLSDGTQRLFDIQNLNSDIRILRSSWK
jgi:hypothetical protein